MKTLRCFLVFTCIFAAGAAFPAFAEQTFTIFGAAQHQGKLTLQSAQGTATTTSNLDPRTFGEFGIRYGHGKVIGGEHTFAYAPNFIEGNTRAVIYNSNLMVQAPLPKVTPYGTVGLGAVFTWSDDSNGRPAIASIGNKFAINYGGGVKIFPAGPVGVRFDLRGYTLPSVKFNVPASIQTQTVQTQDQSLSFFEYGFGIVFRF
jgi:hypothetical protein